MDIMENPLKKMKPCSLSFLIYYLVWWCWWWCKWEEDEEDDDDSIAMDRGEPTFWKEPTQGKVSMIKIHSWNCKYAILPLCLVKIPPVVVVEWLGKKNSGNFDNSDWQSISNIDKQTIIALIAIVDGAYNKDAGCSQNSPIIVVVMWINVSSFVSRSLHNGIA